jgi:hypothetical protein
LHQPLDLGRLVAKAFGDRPLAQVVGHVGDGQGVAVHIGVDGGPVAAAADGDLHAVQAVVLPEQPVGVAAFFFPAFVVGNQVGQELFEQAIVAGDEITGPERVGGPEAITADVAAFV